MSRPYLLLALCLSIVMPVAAMGQQVPTPADAPPTANPAKIVSTTDQVVSEQAPEQNQDGEPTLAPIPNQEDDSAIAQEQKQESGPTLAPQITAPQQVEVLPEQTEVLPDGVVQSQPEMMVSEPQTYTITPRTFGELIRGNAEARRRLHDAQTEQERMLRDQHRAERYSLEQQIRMMPAGSYARQRLVAQLAIMRREHAEEERYLDDYNDAQRERLRQLHRQQEATARSRLTVQPVVTVPHVHIDGLYAPPQVQVNVPQTVIAPRPVYVPPAATVRVNTRRGLFRRGAVNVNVPRASVRVGW